MPRSKNQVFSFVARDDASEPAPLRTHREMVRPSEPLTGVSNLMVQHFQPSSKILSGQKGATASVVRQSRHGDDLNFVWWLVVFV